MKVLVAMDEFNGIISSYQANRYVEEAVASQIERADIVQVPLFNGRHELMDSVFLWQSGTKYRIMTHDADMNKVEAVYGITDNDVTVIEGNLFLKGTKPINQRTSYGLGELIVDALENHAKHIIISLGGIDSFDGGAGMLQALGMKFYDDEANEVDVTEGTRVLKYIRKIDASGLHPQLKDVRLQLMSDFDSKLYGKESEIIQLHEQLGLERNDAAEIDNLIWYLSEIFKSEMKLALGPIAKGGAGGGIAAVLHALYDAEIMTSHELVDQITHLESLIAQADLVIFGEGVSEEDRLLETTTIRIAELATKHHKPSIAICATDDKFDLFESMGVTSMFNTFIQMPKYFTDFKMGIQIRHYAVQAIKLLKTDFDSTK
ncbi:glycerate kinase [Staphylococcus gallinarum]|uniref:Glycerate kinase n=1 Tax=Staphylococcus gallinarum TaxID=1293 RepID=A0ABQ0XYM3_STAGA|nr:glycerate kinase [Staphylococcus gallinarum]KIR12518.1 glycerate kinase [Staphylococcus gallinarum]MBU7218091.1 glycerate kinase [Staphylococcus gallinarum]MCD8794544.1 glycerate kinase [Staphylococcus gallinarum]MCD8825192.1 glycerate kinase [Staphylococcus gallinarum]MCD8830217.1 glycerate kinase [Staphylococcus gallinarum]